MGAAKKCAPFIEKGEIDTFLNFLSSSCFVSANNLVRDDGTVVISGFEWANYSSI